MTTSDWSKPGRGRLGGVGHLGKVHWDVTDWERKKRSDIHRLTTWCLDSMRELTSTELLEDVGRPQSAEVPSRKPPQQSHARSKAFDARGGQWSRFGALAIEDDGEERSTGLGELMNDVDSV